MSSTYVPVTPKNIQQNPIRSGEDWRLMREVCEADTGAFHGNIAAEAIHWYHPQLNAWLCRSEAGHWQGWDLLKISCVG